MQTPLELYLQAEPQAQLGLPHPALPNDQLLTPGPAPAEPLQSTPASAEQLQSTPAPADQLQTEAPADQLQTEAPADQLQTETPADQLHTTSPTTASSKQATAEPVKKRQKRNPSRNKRNEQYIIKFKGNNSQRWDYKQISVDGEWLEELYNKRELCCGRVVELPWGGKDSKTVVWRGVIMSIPDEEDEGELKVASFKAN